MSEKPERGAALLQLARHKAGLTQAELARRAGVSAEMISRYERGERRPTLPTLEKLLRAAGFELRTQLAPYNAADHDTPLAPASVVDRWRGAAVRAR